MASRMLKFTSIDRAMPEKRDAKARAHDFEEIYADYAKKAAEDQAGRCSQCGVPFCQQGCPLSNNIPDWLKLVAEDRMEEAYQVSSATNNMPEICGRICPQDRLCEGICTVEQSGHGISEQNALTGEEQADELLLMGLRVMEGVDLSRWSSLSGRTVDAEREARG